MNSRGNRLKVIELLTDFQGAMVGQAHGLEQEIDVISHGKKEKVSLFEFLLKRGAKIRNKKEKKHAQREFKTPPPRTHPIRCGVFHKSLRA